jgi:hypothetical protein
MLGGGWWSTDVGGGTVVTIEELFRESVAVAVTLNVVLLSRFKLLDGSEKVKSSLVNPQQLPPQPSTHSHKIIVALAEFGNFVTNLSHAAAVSG